MLLHGIFIIFYLFVYDIHAPVRDVVIALMLFGSIISITDFSLAKESFMKIGEFLSAFWSFQAQYSFIEATVFECTMNLCQRVTNTYTVVRESSVMAESLHRLLNHLPDLLICLPIRLNALFFGRLNTLSSNSHRDFCISSSPVHEMKYPPSSSHQFGFRFNTFQQADSVLSVLHLGAFALIVSAGAVPYSKERNLGFVLSLPWNWWFMHNLPINV
jgi:hypothetical protein